MNTLVEYLHAGPALVSPAVLAALVIAESGLLIGVFLPGATALLALGFLTQVDRLPLPAAVACGVSAAAAGSTLGYLAGRRFGVGIAVWRLSRRVGDRLGLPAGWIRPPGQLPGHLIVAGQWVVGARTLVPRLAGASGVSYRQFARFGMPSAALWGGVLVVIGYLAGGSYTAVSSWLTLAGLIVLLPVATGRLLRRRIGMRRCSGAMASTPGGNTSQ